MLTLEMHMVEVLQYTYVSNEFMSSVLNPLTFSEPFIESIGVEALIRNKKCLFVCIYRPPSGHFNSFYETMSEILTIVYEKKISKCLHFW